MIFIPIVPGDVTNTSKPPLRKVPSKSPDMISSTPKTTTIPKTDGHQETTTLQPSTILEISSSPTRQDVTLQVRIMSRHVKFIERGFFNKSSLDKVTQSSYYLRICDYWTYYVVYRLHRKDFTSLSNLRSLSLYCLATSDDKSLKDEHSGLILRVLLRAPIQMTLDEAQVTTVSKTLFGSS